MRANVLILYPPQLPPRLTLVISDERDEAVFRKHHAGFAPCYEQRKQSGQVRKMAGDQDVVRFTMQAIAHPLRWIVRLQITGGGQLSQRIARPPERLSRLLRAQFPAVPDDRRLRPVCRRLRRDPFNVGTPLLGKRPARINVRGDGVCVMGEV